MIARRRLARHFDQCHDAVREHDVDTSTSAVPNTAPARPPPSTFSPDVLHAAPPRAKHQDARTQCQVRIFEGLHFCEDKSTTSQTGGVAGVSAEIPRGESVAEVRERYGQLAPNLEVGPHGFDERTGDKLALCLEGRPTRRSLSDLLAS